MSTYKRITKHPQTRFYEKATWIDDYFGPHLYGVAFESDGKVYPPELVDRGEVKNFWTEDVKAAFLKFLEQNEILDYPEERLMLFLNNVETAYRERWDRDPLMGEGATMDDTE